MYFLTGIQPSSILTEDIDFLEDSAVLLQNHADATVLPDLLGPRKIPVHGTRGSTGSEGCLLLCSAVGNSLIFPMTLFLCLTCQIRRRKAGL